MFSNSGTSLSTKAIPTNHNIMHQSRLESLHDYHYPAPVYIIVMVEDQSIKITPSKGLIIIIRIKGIQHYSNKIRENPDY